MRGTVRTGAWALPTGSSVAGSGDLAHIESSTHQRRRLATDPTWPRERSSSVLLGTFLASSGPVSQTSALTGDHPIKYVIGLAAVGLFGWLGWVMSRFGRDTAADPGVTGDVGDMFMPPWPEPGPEVAQRPAPRAGAGPRRRLGRAAAREVFAPARPAKPPVRSRPLGPEDDERFMRHLNEQLARDRAKRQRDQDDDPDAD